MVRTLVAAGLLMAICLPAGAQVPPPPPLPGQIALGERLVATLEAKDVAGYAALLSDDLRVFEDGRQLAGSKAEWIRIFGEKLAAKGVMFRIEPGYSSTGRLLFIEYFNSTDSWGGELPSHCCWSHDAVAYDVVGGKVAVIRRLRGGDMRLGKDGAPQE